MARFELGYALEYALRRENGPEGECLVDSRRIESAWDGGIRREDRLYLASEIQIAAMLADVERANTLSVSAEYEAARQ